MVPDVLEALRLPIVPREPRPEFAAALLRCIRDREPPPRSTATVRYFVDELEPALRFYRDRLDFEEEERSPTFAMLYRGDLRLLLCVPGPSHSLPDGTLPEPGGWNRISLQVPDLAAAVESLRAAGAGFRSGIVRNPAVLNALVEDPSGNLVELFEPLAGYHERASSRTT
jgi:catechol 2,3-dioxygenase-like lactoylglutathione lyase family enzyme